jgi:hypothetical protein
VYVIDWWQTNKILLAMHGLLRQPVIAAAWCLICLVATSATKTDAKDAEIDENAPPIVPGAEIWAAIPPPAPAAPTDAQLDATLASDVKRVLEVANASGMNKFTDYTTTPTLARSFETTPWRGRDQNRVSKGKVLLDDDTQLREGNGTLTMAGSMEEKAMAVHMTRHGLFRRSDSKFAEFITQPTGSGADGYGLWRTWESHGACPIELLIADPWGTLSWEASPGRLRTYQCSWVVRPGMYRHGGYFKLSRAPITLVFRTFSLAAPHEVLDVYDGAQAGAALLGRYTSQRLPDQITSTGSEVLVVLRADRELNATQYWTNMSLFLSQGKLRETQALFISAARSKLVGFYRQPMRRIIRALAVRLSANPQSSWMRRVWFAAGERPEYGFERDYNSSLSSVLQDLTDWSKRSRHEEGKEAVPWDSVLGARRYPAPMLEPDRNPFHPGTRAAAAGTGAPPLNVDIDEAVQLQRYLGFLEERPSGFSLDFTTSADCYGAGITPYGEGVFPPLTFSSDPIRNFEYLPFPLQTSSCQPMILSGSQVTRDRPYTVADTVMKTSQEEELKSCLQPGYCDYRVTGRAAGNCTDSCDVLLTCVQEQMGNRSLWKIGPNLYNKSLAARGRETCTSLPEAASCVNVQYGSKNLLLNKNWKRDTPKNAICLDFGCLSCAITSFKTYTDCAIGCSANLENPDPQCIDCSYSFQDSYNEIDALRDRLWVGYLSGAFGYHICPECSVWEAGMMGGPEIPLTPGCRRCHYALEDVINADVFGCVDGGIATSRRCFSTDRDSYNYDLDFFGVVKPGATVILTLDGTISEDADDGGYNYDGAAG